MNSFRFGRWLTSRMSQRDHPASPPISFICSCLLSWSCACAVPPGPGKGCIVLEHWVKEEEPASLCVLYFFFHFPSSPLFTSKNWLRIPRVSSAPRNSLEEEPPLTESGRKGCWPSWLQGFLISLITRASAWRRSKEVLSGTQWAQWESERRHVIPQHHVIVIIVILRKIRWHSSSPWVSSRLLTCKYIPVAHP